jgi:hypothetical protein
MLDRDVYIAQKLKEFDDGASHRQRMPAPERVARPRRRVLAPAARLAGRQIRHLGQALEAWGRPAPRDAGL